MIRNSGKREFFAYEKVIISANKAVVMAMCAIEDSKTKDETKMFLIILYVSYCKTRIWKTRFKNEATINRKSPSWTCVGTVAL